MPKRGHRKRPYRLSEHKLFTSLRDKAARLQGGKCHWCGTEMRRDVPENAPDYLTGDHLVPKHAGGKTVAGNIVAACRRCNNSRHPELNRAREPRSLTVGEETHHSPFDVLKK